MIESLAAKWLLRIGVTALLMFISFIKGCDYQQDRNAIAAAKEQQEQIDHAADQARIGREVSKSYQTKLRYAEKQAAQLQERIKEYVSDKADRNCVVNNGFVRLHDEAAQSLYVPSATGGSDDDASGIALSESAARIASNYAACAANTEQLKQLQEWARRVSEPAQKSEDH